MLLLLLLTNRVVQCAWIINGYVRIRAVYGATFEPVCEESEACSSSYDKAPSRDGPDHQPVCKCSGDWNDAVEVVDIVQIPEGLKPGKYVLGWRWDCEESTQASQIRVFLLVGLLAGVWCCVLFCTRRRSFQPAPYCSLF